MYTVGIRITKGESMKFFTPSQASIYESSWGFIVQRLERILELSPSEPSKEAFFFLLRVLSEQYTEHAHEIIDLFYKDHQLFSSFLNDLNGWIKAENNNSRFIKAITDPRLRTPEQLNTEYTKELQKEFGQNVAEALRLWAVENAPENFYETKYPLLYEKYAHLLKPHSQEAPASSP